MRRSLAAALVAIGTGLASLPAAPAAVAEEPAAPPAPATPAAGTVLSPWEAPAAAVARRTLVEATDVLVDGAATAVPDAEATLLLSDLFVALPSLRGADREQARALLARPTARPTDGTRDQYGDGYSVGSTKKCSANFCLHHVTTTADAPPSRGWVATTLRQLDKVWRKEVTQMGYRPPVKDGKRGGNAKFDVYLKELGSKGLYGYCAPEYRKKGTKWVASGYCVLDNDFAEAQYGAPPLESLRVTAAHEFFHAVQFAYDYHEDRWLLESTATWIEERVADDVDDNRQYLPAGQVKVPARSLDVFSASGFAQYGNWTFWEHLSGRFGNGIVKQVWNKAGAFRGAPDLYSAQALRRVLAGRGGLPKVYARYAASNTAPARYYPEGATWPRAGYAHRATLTPSERRTRTTTRIDHLAARNVLVQPDAGLSGSGWALRITVDGPGAASSPAVHVLVRTHQGAWDRKVVPLTRKGFGKAVVAFDAAQVSGVSITLANASTRYRCGRGTNLSCRGKAVDQDKQFTVKAVAFQR